MGLDHMRYKGLKDLLMRKHSALNGCVLRYHYSAFRKNKLKIPATGWVKPGDCQQLRRQHPLFRK